VAGSYAKLVRRVWRRLEERTGMAPLYPERHRLDSFCPVCRTGTISVHFIDPPNRSAEIEVQPCTLGCPEQDIYEALLR
jgi:hypothetical protein